MKNYQLDTDTETQADQKLDSPKKLENPSQSPQSDPQKAWYFFGLLMLVSFGVWMFSQMSGEKKSPIVFEKNGEAMLAPHRQEKLNKELEEIENAIQYSLRASIDGYFPCHTCPDSTRTIYLYKGQVWRYGSTRKEENERYPGGNYGASNIVFVPEFRGTIAECLRMEKIKIYNYPLLPEARAREFLLAIPPGNKIDN
jgi:hypothetical protein